MAGMRLFSAGVANDQENGGSCGSRMEGRGSWRRAEIQDRLKWWAEETCVCVFSSPTLGVACL